MQAESWALNKVVFAKRKQNRGAPTTVKESPRNPYEACRYSQGYKMGARQLGADSLRWLARFLRKCSGTHSLLVGQIDYRPSGESFRALTRTKRHGDMADRT